MSVISLPDRNLVFVTGSLLAVLLVLTVLQEDLLTAHNVLTYITLLGLAVTICRIFIPNEVGREGGLHYLTYISYYLLFWLNVSIPFHLSVSVPFHFLTVSISFHSRTSHGVPHS